MVGEEEGKLKKVLYSLVWVSFVFFAAYPVEAAFTWSMYDQFDGATIDESKWILETEGSGAVWPYLAGGRLVLEANALPYDEADTEIHVTSPSGYTGIMADLHFASHVPYGSYYFEGVMEMKVDFGNDYAATIEIRAENSGSLVGTAFIEYNPDAPHPQLPEQSVMADWGQVHSVGIAVDENNILFSLDGSVFWACDAEIYNPAFADATIEILTSGGEVTGYVDNVQLATTGSIPGACCLPDGSCMEAIAIECASAGGTYQGDGSDCASANCGGFARTLCSTLGDDPRPYALEMDEFIFTGTEGETVTVTLESSPPEYGAGQRAVLIMRNLGRGLLLFKRLNDQLPLEITVTLPATADYHMKVMEAPGKAVIWGEKYEGDYCVTLEASPETVGTFVPDLDIE